MNSSDLVFQHRTEGDGYVVRATVFTGPDRHILDIAAALLRAGYRLEAAEGIIPGLWHIDGGPELTTNQMFGVARRLLTPQRPPSGS